MARATTGKKSGSRRSAPAPAGAELLLEIGTEELPYQFIASALRSLSESAERLFKEHRLGHGPLRAFGTPRRLVLTVQALAARQTAAVKEVMGPSKAVAYDAAGTPSKALTGFMASQGITIAEVQTRQTNKGDYVFAVKRDEGRPASAVLTELLPGLIAGLVFPKSMKWNESGLRFARPIRWLLAVYGGKPVPFQVGGVSSGNSTRAHRFLGSTDKGNRRGFPVKDLASYLNVLARHGVIPEQDKRRTMILTQLDSLARSVKGHLHRDEELLEQAVYTVEYPHAILGSFNQQYLSLPKEIIMTAMKEHQGFFSVTKRDGSLLPQFVSVTNMKLSEMSVIRWGNERVLAARLADAKFFFDEDRKVPLADRVEKLKGVVFHQKIGTQYQRTQRIVALVNYLVEGPLKAAGLAKLNDRDAVRRAAHLSKADLLTGIVGEFPTLQGVMGGEYARHDREPDGVCRALAEQYLPRSADDELPKSQAGMVLSLADRLDTIFAFFAVGLVPSGSEDPFALRRHALAVVRIILEGKLPLSLGEVANAIGRILRDDKVSKPTAGTAKAGEGDPQAFILDRLRYYGRTVGKLRDDVMEAVLKQAEQSPPKLPDLYDKMKALQALSTRPEFDPLMVGFKRAHRIVEKENWTLDEINPALFQHPTEVELHKVLGSARLEVPYAVEQGNYETALNGLVGLKVPIDAFFKSVMVNTDEQELRKNRLSLLYAIDLLFMSFADFSQIVVRGA